jgi:hypothetical protein
MKLESPLISTYMNKTHAAVVQMVEPALNLAWTAWMNNFYDLPQTLKGVHKTDCQYFRTKEKKMFQICEKQTT